MSSQYRPDIDGLRAVSVLIVVLYHAFPDALPSGFIGVDVFFVISGFLITRLTIEAMRCDTFSFPQFYGRRIRRIFPALLLVSAAASVAALILLSSSELRQYGAHLASVALSVPNLLLWLEAGYFDAASDTKALLHAWSLGVEEQFYLLWPILLAVGFSRRVPATAICALVFAGSFATSFYLSASDPTQAFYSPISRGWELAAGGILASAKLNIPDRYAAALSGAGLLLIVIAAFFVDPEQHFPAPYALIPVIGACAIIAAGYQGWLNRRALSALPTRYLGLISYPLYLWHWPVLVFARQAGYTSTAASCGAIAISIILAGITYFALERPIHQKPLRKTVPWLIAGMAATLGLGLSLKMNDPRLLMYPTEVRSLLSYVDYDFATDARLGICWLTEESGISSFDTSCTPKVDSSRPTIAVLGDSYAARLYPGLAEILGRDYAIAQFTVSSCPSGGNEKPFCAARHAEAMKSIRSLSPALVILFSRWQAYTDDWVSGPYARNLQRAVADLNAQGATVLVLGPAPEYQPNLPQLLFEHWQQQDDIPRRLAPSSAPVLQSVDAQLGQLAASAGATYISLANLLCESGGCVVSSPKSATDLYSWDYGHFTAAGASFVATELSAAIRSAASKP